MIIFVDRDTDEVTPGAGHTVAVELGGDRLAIDREAERLANIDVGQARMWRRERSPLAAFGLGVRISEVEINRLRGNAGVADQLARCIVGLHVGDDVRSDLKVPAPVGLTGLNDRARGAIGATRAAGYADRLEVRLVRLTIELIDFVENLDAFRERGQLVRTSADRRCAERLGRAFISRVEVPDVPREHRATERANERHEPGERRSLEIDLGGQIVNDFD